MVDKIKIGAAFLLIIAGVAGFYALHESAAVVKLAVLLLGILLAAAVIWTTDPGKRLFIFGKESVAEAKRVVWPTRKETIQTTGVVIAFAVTMALFLWAVDASLMVVVNKLMGRSE
jgi:preprotein translocase subunit SecE